MKGSIGNGSIIVSRRREPSSRRGFALAAALLMLLLISALVTGVFFAVTEETRVGSAMAERQRALSAAESAIEMTFAEWNANWPGPVGASVTRFATIPEVGKPVVVNITRLDSTMYWIVSDATAQSRGAAASARIGVGVRVEIDSDHSITINRISERSWSELF